MMLWSWISRRPTATPQYQAIVQELQQWVQSDNDRRVDFEKAIETIRSYNMDELSNIQSFTDYLDFINSLLIWIPSERVQAQDIFNQFGVFYFVLDQPSTLPYQSPITPSSSGPLSWLSAWIVRYGRAIGAFMDTPESLTATSLETFKSTPTFHFNDYLEPRGGWRTFNDFFARHVKPGYRPIADHPAAISSPADWTYNGQFAISPTATVTLKTLTWRISELLADSPYSERFAGGTWIHGYLGTNDYHRVHAPLGGRVLEARAILGQHYAQIEVRDIGSADEPLEQTAQVLEQPKQKIVKRREFDAPNETGYQFVQARGLVVLETARGLVAVLPVGMAVVSSVVLTAEVGVVLRKGEELAYFQFGGSDVVVLFEAEVELSAVVGRHYRMGREMGRVRGG
ncbi:hypothetical protein MMC26_001784 [Xylographa opegraphella]|nr:hypothetical protein [Xylographa opegraphella]